MVNFALVASPPLLLENGKDCQTYIEKDLTEIVKNATEEYPNFAKVHIEGGLIILLAFLIAYNTTNPIFHLLADLPSVMASSSITTDCNSSLATHPDVLDAYVKNKCHILK